MEHRKNGYDKSYKLILLVPVVILLFSVFYLWSFNNQHGDIILKDVSLTGGTTVSVIDSSVDINDLKLSLEDKFPDMIVREISEFRTGKQKGFFLETKAESGEIKEALEGYLGYELNPDNSSIEFSGSTLSEGFYKQLRFAIVLAFIFMAIVVFVVFRTFVPSIAVILSAFADITMTLMVVNILGVPLSTAGVIAFLMLIGYSVDTDIMLTSRLLKERKESVNKTIFEAFKTGITMTITSMGAVAVGLIIIFNLSDALRQIFGVLLIGLGFDIMNTWFANASILKWYIERKGGRR